jgi:osmotically-inducible protein OsmY
MSRKNHRDYNGRQGSGQRPWDQQGGQNSGGPQRSQYDNIGRDRYGSNTGQGGGYGSADHDDEYGRRPNWPGEQGAQNRGRRDRNTQGNPQSQGNSGWQGGYGSQGYGSRGNYGASSGYGSSDADQTEEYGEQRFGNDDSGRRYRSQGFGSDQGMSRYQGSRDDQDAANERSWGGSREFQNWGEGDAEYGGSNQGRSGAMGSRGRNEGLDQDRGGRGNRGSWQAYNDQQFGGETAGRRSQGQHSGRGPKGYRRGDERILEDINEQLTHHSEIDAGDIEVKVTNGEVTLTGTVDNREAKRMAEDVAEAVSGVTDVQNQIRVVRTVGAARGKDQDEESNGRGEAGRSGSSTSSSDSAKSRNKSGAGIGA